MKRNWRGPKAEEQTEQAWSRMLRMKTKGQSPMAKSQIAKSPKDPMSRWFLALPFWGTLRAGNNLTIPSYHYERKPYRAAAPGKLSITKLNGGEKNYVVL